MKKNLNLYKGMRPAAVMLLCTCIAFSAVMPYVPPALPAAAEESSGETEYLSETASTAREETETEESRETAAAMDETAPAPYRLNFAHMYEEGAEESYAEILMKELIRKDSQWYAGIYDMANMAPSRLASRLGRSQAKVLGKHNPASLSQDPEDPSTWAVEHLTEMEISRLLYPMPSRSFPWQVYTVITMRSTTWTRSGNTQTSFGVLPILTARPWEMYISAAAVWIHPRSLPERRQIPSWRERIILMEKAVSIRKFPLLNPARPQKGPVKMERAYPVPPVIPSVRASYRTLFQEEIPEALQLLLQKKQHQPLPEPQSRWRPPPVPWIL